MTPHTSRTESCCGAKSPGCRPTDAVVSAALALLDQCDAFVRSLPDTAYAADSKTLKGGTIGKHVRHVLDHYAAILVGLDSTTAIDYDHRERDVPMETRRQSALDNVERTRLRLTSLTTEQLEGVTRIRVMLAGDGSEAELASTIARELAFATHHAVHHHAMMKAIAEEHGVPLSPDFGKAPSTLNHEYRAGARPAGTTPAGAREGVTG